MCLRVFATARANLQTNLYSSDDDTFEPPSRQSSVPVRWLWNRQKPAVCSKFHTFWSRLSSSAIRAFIIPWTVPGALAPSVPHELRIKKRAIAYFLLVDKGTINVSLSYFDHLTVCLSSSFNCDFFDETHSMSLCTGI